MTVNLELLEKALHKCSDEDDGREGWTCPEYRSLIEAAREYYLMMTT